MCVLIAPYLPTWLNGDKAIRGEAASYFMIISIPLLFRTAALILASALRGVSDMKTPMLINLYMNIINIILNFLLIYPTRELFGIIIPVLDWGKWSSDCDGYIICCWRNYDVLTLL